MAEQVVTQRRTIDARVAEAIQQGWVWTDQKNEFRLDGVYSERVAREKRVESGYYRYREAHSLPVISVRASGKYAHVEIDTICCSTQMPCRAALTEVRRALEACAPMPARSISSGGHDRHWVPGNTVMGARVPREKAAELAAEFERIVRDGMVPYDDEAERRAYFGLA